MKWALCVAASMLVASPLITPASAENEPDVDPFSTARNLMKGCESYLTVKAGRGHELSVKEGIEARLCSLQLDSFREGRAAHCARGSANPEFAIPDTIVVAHG